MRIAVPSEIKKHEYRVALTPAGVHELTRRGHDVFVETGFLREPERFEREQGGERRRAPVPGEARQYRNGLSLSQARTCSGELGQTSVAHGALPGAAKHGL